MPTPEGVGLATAVMARFTVGPNFVTKASLEPFNAPCSGLAVGKLEELVSPET